MTDIKGYHINRGPLRALAHAQGQLFRNHKTALLFFALDILDHLKQNQALREQCPEDFTATDELQIYAQDSRKRGAMFTWDLDGGLAVCRTALDNLAAATLGDNAARKTHDLCMASVSYLDMARDIQTPDTGTLRRASKINPYISAEFLAAYMTMIGDKFAHKAAQNKDDLYKNFAETFSTLGQKIKANIPQDITPVYEVGEQKISHVYNMMSLLSDASLSAQQALRAVNNLGDDDRILQQGLAYLYLNTAVYDWEQYETVDENVPAPDIPDNVLSLKAGIK